MGNKISDYLERFRNYCIDQLIEKRYYMYGGSNQYTLAIRNFYAAFINNDVFNVDSELHEGVFYSDDFSEIQELLIDIMEWLREYIKSFDNRLRAIYLDKTDNSSFDFKLLYDAIRVLNILKLHFTWFSGNVFDGKSVSFFERNYFDFADEPFDLVPTAIIKSRIDGAFDNEFVFNYIFYYKAFNNENCDQLMEFFSNSKNNYSSIYDGLLLFTRSAMKKFLLYLRNNPKYKRYAQTEDADYYYISLSTDQVEKHEYICYSTYKMVFHLEENGLFKLVAFKSEDNSFDMSEYRDAPTECSGYSNDKRFKNYLVTEKSEISVPKFIDIFV